MGDIDYFQINVLAWCEFKLDRERIPLGLEVDRTSVNQNSCRRNGTIDLL